MVGSSLSPWKMRDYECRAEIPIFFQVLSLLLHISTCWSMDIPVYELSPKETSCNSPAGVNDPTLNSHSGVCFSRNCITQTTARKIVAENVLYKRNDMRLKKR